MNFLLVSSYSAVTRAGAALVVLPRRFAEVEPPCISWILRAFRLTMAFHFAKATFPLLLWEEQREPFFMGPRGPKGRRLTITPGHDLPFCCDDPAKNKNEEEEEASVVTTTKNHGEPAVASCSAPVPENTAPETSAMTPVPGREPPQVHPAASIVLSGMVPIWWSCFIPTFPLNSPFCNSLQVP